jgi:hypothetical protein
MAVFLLMASLVSRGSLISLTGIIIPAPHGGRNKRNRLIVDMTEDISPPPRYEKKREAVSFSF